ncbi:MAG: hypothetical protein LUG47_05780 [Clostridiales bacterium]|nr:hypothetical protein [Clostridiales bacterium]
MDKYDTYSYAEADVEVIKLVNDHNRKTEQARNEREARKKARQLAAVLDELLSTVVFATLLTLTVKGITGPVVIALCASGTAASVYGLVRSMGRWAK